MTDPSTSITTTTKQRAACLSYLDANTINIRSVCENNEQHYRKQQNPSKTIQWHMQFYFKKRNEKRN